MRISIWQQFSSNHSSNFTVVGIFPTVDQAAEKAKLLHQMIADIQDEQHQLELQRKLPDNYKPVQIEMALSEEYGVEWRFSLDWAWQVDYAVRQIDNYVIVQNVLAETWNGPHPFDQLLERFGAQTLVREEMEGSHIEVDVSATAPNQQIVDTIFDELLPLFQAVIVEPDGYRCLDYEHVAAPWRSYAEEVHYEGLLLDEWRLWNGYLTKDKLQLMLTQLHFPTIGIGLPALLKYLKAKGAIGVQYSMRRKP